MYGQVVSPALDVPQRLLDRSRRGGEHRSAAKEAAPAHALPQLLDPVRWRARDDSCEVLDRTEHRFRALGDDGFAPAFVAVICA